MIARDVDVVPLQHVLMRKPELWNQEKFRTTYDNTPHAEVDDILLRYSAPDKTADPSDTAEVQNDHGAVWYPAAETLPEVKPLVLDLMRYTNAYELTRLLISRLAPGKRILPHADNVGEYVKLGDIARYHIVVRGLPGSLFRCGDEEVNMQSGEIWWFQPHLEHQIVNNSPDDRIHLLADLRKWPA